MSDEKHVEKIVRDIEKKVNRWSAEVINPEVSLVEGRVNYPFEGANKKHLAVVDEIIRLACLDLTKKKIEKPLEALATAMLSLTLATPGLHEDPNRNLAMDLVCVRAIKSADIMRQYRGEDVDPGYKKALYADLVERGLTKKSRT